MTPIIIDSSAWIQYFRDLSSPVGQEVEGIIESGDALLVGVVYAELVRGVRDDRDLHVLEDNLEGIPFLETGKETWRRAGQLLLDLRRQGRTIALPDAVIAAQALEGDHQVYTQDEHFQRVPGLRLHEAKAE